jgi:hypothetical protein
MNDLKIFDYVKSKAEDTWIGSKYKDYFRKYQAKKLYLKFGESFDSDATWENIRSISQRFIINYPSIFYFDKKMSEFYMNLYLSSQILAEDKSLIESIKERGGDDETYYSFMDLSFFYSGNKEIPINKINIDEGYQRRAIKLNNSLNVSACGVGELFSVIADKIADPLNELPDEVILNAIIVKSKKKESLKSKYMEVFPKLLTNIGFKKVVGAKNFTRKYSKMSLPIWEKEVSLVMKRAIKKSLSISNFDLESMDREEVIWKLIQLQMRNGNNISSEISNSYSEFFLHLRKSSFPFQIRGLDFINQITDSINVYIKDLMNIENTKIIAPFKKELRKYNYRTRYIKTGTKTKAMLTNAAHASILLNGALGNGNSSSSNILDIYLLLSEKNINNNEIRNLLSKLYDMNRFYIDGKVTSEFHDIAFSMIPSLNLLLKNFSKDTKYKQFYNKLIKLLVSEIGGSNIDTQTINALSKLKPNILNNLSNEKFSSLSALVGLASFNSKDKIAIEEKIDELQLKHFDGKDNISLKIREMMAGSSIKKILKNYSEKNHGETLLENPLRKEIGKGLQIAIVPHDYSLSLIAAGVNGVCIGLGSEHHAQQHIKECVNLIVYDDKAIYLWGLIVKAKENYNWFLNNFQGRLPNRYAKIKDVIKEESISIMSEIGNVYMCEQYFNAMDLHKGLDKVAIDELTLPKMRLDIHQDKEGKIGKSHLYKVNAKKNSLFTIK